LGICAPGGLLKEEGDGLVEGEILITDLERADPDGPRFGEAGKEECGEEVGGEGEFLDQ
jgi:hypothetical protein